jgi:outer membrane protein
MWFSFTILTTLLFINLIATNLAHAQQYAATDNFSEQHIAIKQWHLSLNTGVGVITNPLHGGDNIPLILIPRVAFYAEQWFFDNGRLGYSFIQSPTHHLNMVSELNTESRFFIDWHLNNIFTAQNNALNSQRVEHANTLPAKYANINDIHTRHVALDAGIAYHYVSEGHVLSAQALHDVTRVYRGFRGALQWQFHAQISKLTLKPTLGINYKSAQLNNYFYGLNAGETQFGKIDVGSSWQPYAKINARWPLNKANSLRFHAAYYDYSAMDGSPLFERTYSMTVFIGLEHTF